MRVRSISKRRYLKTAQYFHWAKGKHFVLYFTGQIKRHWLTEKTLPELVREGKLVAVPYKKELVYSVPRRVRGGNLLIEHGLGCTESLIYFYLCRDGVIVPEFKFKRKGFNLVPDFAIVYPNQKMLLGDFITPDAFRRKAALKVKLSRHQRFIGNIEAAFSSQATAVFIVDAEREDVRKFAVKARAGEAVLFCDWESFKGISVGNHLTSRIFIWEDGDEYPLANHA